MDLFDLAASTEPGRMGRGARLAHAPDVRDERHLWQHRHWHLVGTCAGSAPGAVDRGGRAEAARSSKRGSFGDLFQHGPSSRHMRTSGNPTSETMPRTLGRPIGCYWHRSWESFETAERQGALDAVIAPGRLIRQSAGRTPHAGSHPPPHLQPWTLLITSSRAYLSALPGSCARFRDAARSICLLHRGLRHTACGGLGGLRAAHHRGRLGVARRAALAPALRDEICHPNLYAPPRVACAPVPSRRTIPAARS